MNLQQQSKIATYILVLSPIMQTYGWGKYDFTFILTSILGLYYIIKGEINVKRLPKYLTLYILYWFFIHIISATTLSDTISLGAIKTFIVYAAFFSVIQLQEFLKVYKKVLIICIIFLYVQTFIFALTNFKIPGVISFLPLALNVDTYSSYIQAFLNSGRSCSFFSEPAHFAQFLLPYVCICLYEPQVTLRRKLLKLSFPISALLLLQSGNAIIGLSITIIIYYIYKLREGGKYVLYFPIMILTFVVGISIYSQTEMGQKIMDRKSQININSYDELGYSTSGFERIYRGYYVFEEYSTVAKIFGNDNPDYKILSSQKSVVSQTFLAIDLYFNTIQIFLLNTGIVGCLLFLLILSSLWKKTNPCGRNILLTFVVFCFFSSMYFSEMMCIFLLLPKLLSRTNNISKPLLYKTKHNNI